MVTKSVNDRIIEYLSQKIDPDFIVLFGSRATGRSHSKSDYDLAFYKKNLSLSNFQLYTMSQELSLLVKNDVDLLDLNFANTVFKAQIFSTGICLYAKCENTFSVQQMTALSMYHNLNIERDEIINSILTRGSVFGV